MNNKQKNKPVIKIDKDIKNKKRGRMMMSEKGKQFIAKASRYIPFEPIFVDLSLAKSNRSHFGW